MLIQKTKYHDRTKFVVKIHFIWEIVSQDILQWNNCYDKWSNTHDYIYIFVHIQTLLRFYWCMQFMIALKGFGRGDGGVSLVRHDLIQSKMEIFFRWLLNWPSSRVFRKAHPIINIGWYLDATSPTPKGITTPLYSLHQISKFGSLLQSFTFVLVRKKRFIISLLCCGVVYVFST